MTRDEMIEAMVIATHKECYGLDLEIDETPAHVLEGFRVEAAAALDAIAPVVSWQPIATAPRDGTKVDLAVYKIGQDAYREINCHYVVDESVWIDESGALVEICGWRAYAWRPATALPNPPEAS